MAFDAEVMNNKKSILNRIKLKIKGLLEDIDQLDDHGGDGPPSVAQFLTEMVEENKLLSSKCRELAHLVKNLKQEKKESSLHPKRTNDVDARKQHAILAQCEQEKLELQIHLDQVQTELVESQYQVQLLMAQLMTYKEDFEMERKDRERAVEKIGLLESRLIENDVNPIQTNVSRSYSSQHPSRRTHSGILRQNRREFDGIVPLADGCDDCDALRTEHLVLVPRGFRERKETLEELSGDLEIDSLCAGSKSWASKAGDEQSFREIVEGDRWCNNKHKRKLDHRDSFDKAFDRKLPSLE